MKQFVLKDDPPRHQDLGKCVSDESTSNKRTSINPAPPIPS